MEIPIFAEFPKISRLSRECIVTEKIDGTNGLVHVLEDGSVLAGSKSRYITPKEDNFGFARWVKEHEDELRTLGPGQHHGEWWGLGIQRNYGLTEKRWSLFQTSRWSDDRDTVKFPVNRPSCCSVVPILFRGLFDTTVINSCLDVLKLNGSVAAPGFMKPEGIVVIHLASLVMFKKTIEKDEEWKGKNG